MVEGGGNGVTSKVVGGAGNGVELKIDGGGGSGVTLKVVGGYGNKFNNNNTSGRKNRSGDIHNISPSVVVNASNTLSIFKVHQHKK